VGLGAERGVRRGRGVVERGVVMDPAGAAPEGCCRTHFSQFPWLVNFSAA